MNREEMIRNKRNELAAMTDEELLETARRHFKNNKAMPGQKYLKDMAMGKDPAMDASMCEAFVNNLPKALIVGTKLHNVNALSNAKTNRGKTGLRAHELPMVLADDGRTYEMPCQICPGGKVYIFGNRGFDCHFATLPEKFLKNFHMEDGMQGFVIVTDHSNGNFASMGYELVIDLDQYDLEQ